MRVLITGAAGRLGSYTVEGFLKLGYDVVATDVMYRHGMPVKLHMADLLDRLAVYQLMEGCDAVAHIGNHFAPGVVSPQQRLYSENATMSINVFQAAVDAGIRKILFASSIQAACSRRLAHFPLDEKGLPPSHHTHLPIGFETPPQPGNHYALSKVAGEDMLKMLSQHVPELSCYSIRFPWIMLPHRYRRYPINLDRYPTMIDEAFAYLMAGDALSLMDHLLRNGKPGHHILMPSANDNHLNLRAADLIQLFFKGVPQRKPVDPEGKTLFDVAGLEEAHGWAPKEISKPVEFEADVLDYLKNMIEEAWKTP